MELYHITLGRVKIINIVDDYMRTPNTECIKVEVLTNEFEGIWADCRGNNYYYNKQGNQWWVPYIDLVILFIGPPIPMPISIQKRIRKLWNESNWVLKHPEQAY